MPHHQRSVDRQTRTVEAVVPAIFFATGFAALIYQIVWQRLLTLFLGADLYSVTIVVAAFMGGLGFGNLAGGYAADRLSARARLWLFGLCEAGVTLFAVGSAWIYYDVMFVRYGAAVLSPAAAIALIFGVTLLPTLLMGMSLPLLAAGFSPANPARAWIPRIYGLNTLGAACGAIVTVAAFMPRYDFRTTLLIGAAISSTCVITAIAVSRLAQTSEPVAPSSLPQPIESGLSFRTWLLLYALSGFTALSLEIVWFRALGVILKSNALTFGYLLFFYLGGLGLGSFVGTDPRLRRTNAARLFLLLQGVTLIVAVLMITGMSVVARLTPMRDFVASLEPIYSRQGLFAWMYGAVPLLLIVPATTMMGLSFCALQRAVQTDPALVGRRMGWLQTVNIVGSMVGAVVTGVWLLGAIGSTGTLRVLAVVGVGLLLFASRLAGRVTFAAGAWMVAGACAVVTLPGSDAFWASFIGGETERVVVGEDGSGVLLLREDADTTQVFIGGVSQSWLPYGGIHTALGALPTLLHPRPERVAVIGLGSGDSLFAAGSRRETRSILGIEIVSAQLPALTELASRRAYPALSSMLTDPRIRHLATDGRAYLRRGTERFDVIEADPLLPRSVSAGNLYSVEYFELLRSRLADGGLAVSWMPTDRTLATFVSVFPYVVHVAGLGFGSTSPIVFDKAIIEARMNDLTVREYFARGHVDLAETVRPYLTAPVEHFSAAARNRVLVPDLNHDLFPRDEFGVP